MNDLKSSLLVAAGVIGIYSAMAPDCLFPSEAASSPEALERNLRGLDAGLATGLVGSVVAWLAFKREGPVLAAAGTAVGLYGICSWAMSKEKQLETQR